MKVTGRTQHTTTITGEISLSEIRDFIRGQLKLPDGVQLRVFVRDTETHYNRGHVPEIDLEEARGDLDALPLRFEATLEGTLPVEVAPPPAEPDHAPVCSAVGCQFPSLARQGLCASHLSEHYRSQRTGASAIRTGR